MSTLSILTKGLLSRAAVSPQIESSPVKEPRRFTEAVPIRAQRLDTLHAQVPLAIIQARHNLANNVQS